MKNRKYGKIVSLVLALILTAVMVTACADQSDTGESSDGKKSGDSDKPEVTITATPTPIEPVGEPIVIAAPAWYKKAFDAAVTELKKNHPDQEFVLTIPAYGEIRQFVRKEKDNSPDIFIYELDLLSEFVYDLSEAYEGRYRELFPEALMQEFREGGVLLGIPIESEGIVLFSNLDLLEEQGIENARDTYEGFLAACEQLKQAGIQPIVCDKEFTVSMLFHIILKQVCSDDTFDKLAAGTEGVWSLPDVIRALEVLQELNERGYIARYTDTDAAETAIRDGKCAFIAGSSMKTRAVADNGPKCSRTGFPAIKGGRGKTRTINTRTILTGIAVRAAANSPDTLSAYAFELAELVNRYIYLEEDGILPAGYVDFAEDAPEAEKALCAGERAERRYLYSDTFVRTQQALELILKEYLDGNIDCDGFASAMSGQ
jgi:hypothetical protein